MPTNPAGRRLRATSRSRTRHSPCPAGPVILPSGLYDAWLDPATPAAALDAMLVPYRAEGILAFLVSTYVNSPGRDGPECIAPVVDDNDVQEGG